MSEMDRTDTNAGFIIGLQQALSCLVQTLDRAGAMSAKDFADACRDAGAKFPPGTRMTEAAGFVLQWIEMEARQDPAAAALMAAFQGTQH